MATDFGHPEDATTLSDLPGDELRVYAGRLGLHCPADAASGELLRLIRERQESLRGLEREALLDICVWGRRPVQHSASKEALAMEIATIKKMRFDDLSERGLYALCLLRGAAIRSQDDRMEMIQALRRAEPWRDYVQRKLRRRLGSMLGNFFEPEEAGAKQETYHYLPETKTPRLKESFEEEGIVGGITRRLRGAADDYVREKLDEIEARIDRKLDEIDRRLSERRDREVHNRLKILKWTLIFSIIVALASLGYDLIVSKSRPPGPAPAPQLRTEELSGE